MNLDDRIEMHRDTLKNMRLADAPDEPLPSPRDINVPWIYRWSPISHYYGDTVRQLLLAAAAFMLLSAPFYADNLYVELPFIVLGTVALVAVSALTNPFKSMTLSADAVVSGVGLVIFELWALLGYDDTEFQKFVLREVLAVIFLFAFYFSTKTLRNMILHRLGKPDAIPESSVIDTEGMSPRERRETLVTADTKEALHELNEYEKMQYTD